VGWGITAVSIALIAFAAVSARFRVSPITPAILFVLVGYLLGTEVLDVIGSNLDVTRVQLLAEVTLALVLFTDASTLDSRVLTGEAGLPARLLSIGLLLTIILGSLIAIWMFPALGLFEAVVLAVLLAPTDAALGQTVVSDRRLPSRLRQGLNVESGLNDGVCVPLLFAAVAFAELDEQPTFDGEILVDLVKEVGIALGVGAVVAVVVAWVFMKSDRRGWLDEQWGQVVPLATAAVAYTSTAELGGSGFIAAFVAGLLYGRFVGAAVVHRTSRLMEELGGILSAVTFFAFGAIVIGIGIVDLDAETIIYAVLSLTVIRMLPVAVSMLGSGAAPQTMAFAGWFGPRGLATIVFMLTVVEEASLPGSSRIVQVATVTVLLSVVAHGVTAPVLTERYVRWLSNRPEGLVVEPHDSTTPAVVPRRSLWHHATRNPR
jgi:NhaP-type Na+/H+ or K+/H+ antiporter